jgi:hypothetical protein
MSDIRTLIRVAETHPPAAPELPEIPEYEDPEDYQGQAVTSGSRSKRPWRIEDEGAGEWALKKKGRADGEIARVLALAEAEKRLFAAKIDARVAEIVAGEQRRSRFFEAVLLEWMSRARATILTGKQKSRKFLFGTIGWRKARNTIVYLDEARAISWARARGLDAGLVRVEWKLERDAVKRYCAANDLVPDGAHFEGGEDVPYVQTEQPPAPTLAAPTASIAALTIAQTPAPAPVKETP